MRIVVTLEEYNTRHNTGFPLIVSNSSSRQRGRASNLGGADKALRKRARRDRRALLRGFRETRYFPRPRENAADCNYDFHDPKLDTGIKGLYGL